MTREAAELYDELSGNRHQGLDMHIAQQNKTESKVKEGDNVFASLKSAIKKVGKEAVDKILSFSLR